VAAVDFAAGNELEPLPAPSIFEQLAGQAGSYVVGAAILLSTVIFISLGLRPALRLLIENKLPERALPAPQLGAEAKPALTIEAPEAAAAALQKLQPPPAPTVVANVRKQLLLKQVEKALSEHEQQAVEILKEWIKEA
jgi:flagellar M-ring protein FliF